MKMIQDFAHQLISPDLAEVLTDHMRTHMEDFRTSHHRYLTAINKLRPELGSAVDAVISAVNQRAASDILFSAALGLKMNWEHFFNPMTPNCTWKQVDFNDYLQETVAHSLPPYREAEQVLTDFYQSLNPRQRKLYQAITEYESHIVTVAPKLAHYYGFLLGNRIFDRIIPGYRADLALTVRYNTMLTDYFGERFLPTEL